MSGFPERRTLFPVSHACLWGGKCGLRMASCALSAGFIDTSFHVQKIIRLSWISNGCARIGLLKEEKGTW
ncbi:hypothetical protein [Lautropia mirabilis]|uniref:hypothetical protein n=1 Tax=Lautropia mirabilis TaxID=47671 RepID=UPI0028D09870|nr:hypothetical protein [Lautropia mirabilis]